MVTSAIDPGDELVVRTRFVPPRLRAQILRRPRVDGVLARVTEFPLTVVKAEAGYGKTTAVASFLAHSGIAHAWYNVGDAERDPHIFLLHLIHALRTAQPNVGARALLRLAGDQRSPHVWGAAVDALSNDLLDRLGAETVLVLDDYDRVSCAEVNAITERLVETMPPRLHLVITARTMPSLRSRARWRASGEMLEVTRPELAFTTDEVASLFAERLNHPLSAEAARAVAAETEGWPIALQMLSQGLGTSHPEALDNLLRRIPGPAELLFDYLAEEVFLRQPPDIRRFLADTACLRRLDADACDHVREADDSAEVLRSLEQRSLFVTYGGAARYHNLFGDFLLRRSGLPLERLVHLHRRAAEYHRVRGDDEETVYHLLEAGDHQAAADLLDRIAGGMAASGRHQALGRWLDQLPPEVLERSPELLVARGETHRLSSRYGEALPAYEKARRQFESRGDAAGEIRAIRGQALVYLDTVRPALAEPLLREALYKTRGDRTERAALFLLRAENALNAGDLRRAERLFRAIQRFASAGDAPAVDPRLYLRDGRWMEGRRAVEAARRAEPPAATQPRPPRCHREPAAVLAWSESMTGDAALARQHAAEALEVGRTLGSPVVECISLSRLGLGWASGHDYDPKRAEELFADSLRVAEQIGSRFRVECLLGFIVLNGLYGRAEEVRAAAHEALAILDGAGDRYMHGVVAVALGAALTLCRDAEAERWLAEGLAVGSVCGDRFTPCLASLWLAIHYSRTDQRARAREAFVAALQGARQHDYGFLFQGTALLGPKDAALWRGLLRRAQEHPELGDYARSLARHLDPAGGCASGLTETESLANAPLYLQTLGPFRAWRRGQEIERGAWSREKALHLLQLLLCNRGRALHREQILEAIWPQSSASTGATGLRVALSALRHAVEPDRASGADGRFVRREGDTIRLALEAGIRVDADEFGRLLEMAREAEAADPVHAISLFESALALYRGDFLVENPYAEWADPERQQLRAAYLGSAERLAALLLRAGEWERASRWAEAILRHDPVWEAAYAILMEAHWRQGNRALAVRAYDRCRKRLRESVGMSPSARTTALLAQISQPPAAS